MIIPLANKRLVAIDGASVVILNPKNVMSEEEAVNLAAWLVAVTYCDREEFLAALTEIENS